MAFVQGDKASSASATSLTTAGLTTTSGNMLVAVMSFGTGPRTLTSITDSNGNTWEALTGNPLSPNSQYNVYGYVAENITGGAAHTVTVNLSGAGFCALSVIELSGRATTASILFQTTNTEVTNVTSHASAATGALAQGGCDVIALVGDNARSQNAADQTYTATSSGWVLPAASNVNTGATTATSFLMYRENVDTASQQATWTSSGSHKAASFIIAVKNAGATLTNPTGTAGNNGTTGSGTVDTDTASGTLYIYTSTSATPPSGTDLKAGTGAAYATSQAISSTGTKTFSAIAGLSISTAYYNHYLHNDGSNDSAIVTSAAFTMKNPGYITPAIYLPNTEDVAASLTDLTLVIRTTFGASGSLVSVTNEATDAGGVLAFASTAISVGTAYKGVLWRDNGGEDEGLPFTFTAIDLDV